MKLHRFYLQEKIIENSQHKSVDVDLIHQLRDVFRMKKGDTVVLFDGSPQEFSASIELLTRKEVIFNVGEGQEKIKKVTKEVHLFISIIKKDKLELALEKATELGVVSITPVVAERSQYKQIRQDRLLKVIKEASEQSGRINLPELREAKTISEVLKENPDIYVLDMEGDNVFPKKSENIGLLVGPEGGWSDTERELFKERGAKVIILPFDTLRSETAVIVGVALAQT